MPKVWNEHPRNRTCPLGGRRKCPGAGKCIGNHRTGGKTVNGIHLSRYDGTCYRKSATSANGITNSATKIFATNTKPDVRSGQREGQPDPLVLNAGPLNRFNDEQVENAGATRGITYCAFGGQWKRYSNPTQCKSFVTRDTNP